MGKKVKEYKSGDFIFAKVKGYPAWPARVQKLNGKKYFVYFYGTGETANLPPNMIFDYEENKDKFLTKTVKRRDFNEGVKQIEHDFANNVPLEQVIGAPLEAPAEGANDTANDTGNDTMEDSAIDTTAADETVADMFHALPTLKGMQAVTDYWISALTTASTQNATQNDTTVEDSDEAGALVIDEGKAPLKPGRKSKAAPEPAKTPKTPKTPRGKAKKEEKKEEEEEKPEEAKEELVSRSGRKIRPKRYIDEQTEENATLPSPAPKKRRGASPQPEKPAEKEKEAAKEKEKEVKEKNIKHFNNVPQLELEDLKEPFKPADAEKENILIAYLPSGQYCGIKLFQSRPANFKDEAARLQWDKQAASNAVTLKNQLERGHITPQSIIGQLVMDLNLTDEEKASLDKERETEEKKSRVQFLKTEMKLIELDAKIKTCLCLEKADVEQCLKLLDELMELDMKPLMLLKHPCCVETVKRMRAYVGNAPRWQLSDADAVLFASRAHNVRKQADSLYKRLKELFSVPSGLSFWEYFSSRVQQFQRATATLSADQLLEMVHEPAELSQPCEVTMQSAIDAANKEEPPLEEDEPPQKKKNAKAKKAANNNTPVKQPPKRQSSRSQKQQEEKEKEAEKTPQENEKSNEQETPQENQENDKQTETNDAPNENADSTEKETEEAPTNNEQNAEKEDTTNDKEGSDVAQENDKEPENDKPEETVNNSEENAKKSQDSEKKTQDSDKKSQDSDKKSQDSDKKSQDSDKKSQDSDKKSQESDKKTQESDKNDKKSNKKSQDEKKSQENDKEKSDGEKETNDHGRETRKEKKKELEQDKQKDKEDEPRAKRSRGENKKTDPPPRSPAKRKSKA